MGTVAAVLVRCLQNLLAEHRYEYVLDRACVQFEPDNPDYIRVQSTDSIVALFALVGNGGGHINEVNARPG